MIICHPTKLVRLFGFRFQQFKENVNVLLIAKFICRGCDFNKSGFGPRTFILCDQVFSRYYSQPVLDDHMIFVLKARIQTTCTIGIAQKEIAQFSGIARKSILH